MPDILHDLPVTATPDRVFDAIATPLGLDAWWTERAEGKAAIGARWTLGFGPECTWTAVVHICSRAAAIEWELIESDDDWRGTQVGFRLAPEGAGTAVRFSHRGWREPCEHHRATSFCWAMYLRLLKRFVERGERVEHALRLDA